MIDDLFRRHDQAAAAAGSAPAQPSLRTALVTCMDARIDQFAMLGASPFLRPGGVVRGFVLDVVTGELAEVS